MLQSILVSFVSVFVAVDAVGVLPLFVTLTEGMDERGRRRVIVESVVTAICLAVGFVVLGKGVFRLLGICVGDFLVAGGVILFCLAIMDIVSPTKRHRLPGEQLGVVPLGTPLLAGPAVLTTSLMTVSEYGVAATLISVVLNIALAGLVFLGAGKLMRVLGQSGSKALSKITSLLLAAIAVMLARKGIVMLVCEMRQM